ncbi:MAG: 30S ribosomal protein S12 methylthiotransferase RimO [Rikenellaceae bacterium]|jgi:ribosomal protein S12 methylthiotransferase|nr:30S ribosomal protein S12 methylthiotransferase RimO [Rikenellaceae bacterium]
MKKRAKINVVTLGCSKNTVDSEHLMAQLEASGFAVEADSNEASARTVIVNTCGFIGDAKEESVNTVLDFVRAKEAGQIDRLYVVGCLGERYGRELAEEIPEADGIFGVNDWQTLVEALGGIYDPALATRRHLTTPGHYAYLKVSEGCNRGCGYCAIPLIRGKHRSVPMEELLAEAELMAQKGVRELIVIAQDTTAYGTDLYGENRLAELLRGLCAIAGIEWVRLHYTYPAHFPQEVIEVLAREPKLCKYIDIPFQHISDNQLRAMRRGITREQTFALIDELRRRVPDLAIRTTLLTGYPGETEADFGELLAFVETCRFDRLGVFPYSEEEDTYSARHLADDVPEAVKQERVERLMRLQNRISLENNLRRVGALERVMIDRREGDFWVGRTQYDSPEVDQEVLVRSETPLPVGDFCRVRITEAEDYDLYAVPE